MSRNLLFVITVVVCALFTSCKESNYPIDAKPAIKIDARLIGTWKPKKKSGKSPLVDPPYVISKENDFEYRVTIKEKDKGKDKEEWTTGYLSKIDDALFMNVVVKDDSGGYFFFRILNIDTKNGKVTVASIADTTMIHLANSVQVRERITRNLNNPVFYKDTSLLVKVN
jgi:hypothetical protein